jgi:hypothetical protein
MEGYEKHEFREWPPKLPRELSEMPDLFKISQELAAMVDAEIAAIQEPVTPLADEEIPTAQIEQSEKIADSEIPSLQNGQSEKIADSQNASLQKADPNLKTEKI